MTDRFKARWPRWSTRRHELAEPALRALPRDVHGRAAGASTSGSRCRPARPIAAATSCRVKQLMQHPDFNIRNPNRARSLIFSYCSANPGAFHRPDAAGYVFWSDRVIELDAHQSAGRRAPGARAGPLEKLAEPLSQRGARGDRPRGREARPVQRRARGRHAARSEPN